MSVLNFDPNRPPSRWEGWSANVRIRTIIIVAVAALLLARLLTMGAAVDQYWRGVARWFGMDVAPRTDLALANARLKPDDIQRAFGNPAHYPDDARDRGDQGTVSVVLSITTAGRVSACRLDSSSGSASLDEATCRVARRVLRFEPARNSSGEPISSSFNLRVRWQLPDS